MFVVLETHKDDREGTTPPRSSTGSKHCSLAEVTCSSGEYSDRRWKHQRLSERRPLPGAILLTSTVMAAGVYVTAVIQRRQTRLLTRSACRRHGLQAYAVRWSRFLEFQQRAWIDGESDAYQWSMPQADFVADACACLPRLCDERR